MYRKKTVIMIAMIAAVMLMALGYAAFATRLNINATGNITSTWNVYFSTITEGVIVGTASNNTPPSVSGTTAYFDMNLRLPGESITYEVTLTNGGTVGAIISDIKAEAEGSSAIIYSISGLKVGDKLAGGASKTITVKTEYADVMDQPSVTSKTLVITIDAVQDVGQTITQNTPSVEQVTQLRSAILKNNIAYADNISSPYVTNSTGIDFSKPSSDTNGKGLYYTSTNTEGRGTSYYFRGAVENNYVQFGTYQRDNNEYHVNPVGERFPYGHDTYEKCMETAQMYGGTDCTKVGASKGEPMYWRILRINEDGTIRMVYAGTNLEQTTGKIVDHYFSSTYGVTIKYVEGGSKGRLEYWYANQLEQVYGSYIADSVFCNDIEIFKTVNGVIYEHEYSDAYYNGYNRVTTYNPVYSCSHNSKLTVANGKLSKPIGLITVDEVMYAGAVFNTTNTNYYLKYLDTLTMTPSNYNTPLGPTPEVYTVNNGSIETIVNYFSDMKYVYPVINLKSDVGITGGDGTSTNPYVISLD